MGKCGCCAMNNNQTSERAVLGQYATTSYITIADPYGKKTQGLSRHKKKQFLTEPGHLGRSNDTMFCKSFPWLSEGDKYKGQQMYLKTQPLASRKKGFLSSDAHRTDEFTNVCRTEQHRWALGREAAMKKLHEKKKPRRLGDYMPSSYEIGNEAVQATELAKPTYANTPIIQSTFYRVESVKSNAGWKPIR